MNHRQPRHLRDRGLNRQPRNQTKALRRPSKDHNFWTSPWTYFGLTFALIAIAIPIHSEMTTKRAIVILSLDSSASAIADVSVGENVCRNTIQRLRSGDTFANIPYAETTEITRNSKVGSPTTLFLHCDEYRNKKIAGRLGKSQGTSPMLLFDRINNSISAQRKQGNNDAVVVLSYLQAAEPGPNLPPLNFDLLADKIAAVQKQRGSVVLIGPTGDLRQQLDEMNAKRSELKNLQICTVAEQDKCIREAVDLARQL